MKEMSEKDKRKVVRELFMFIGLIFAIGLILTILVLVFFNKPAYGADKRVASGSFIIGGYEPNKYAIDDDKIRQINSGISTIEKDTAKLSGGVLKPWFTAHQTKLV